MLQPAHTTPPRRHNPNQGNLHGRAGLPADGKRWVRVGGTLVPGASPRACTLGCSCRWGAVTLGQARMPGLREAGDREGAHGAEPALGPGGLFPNPQPSNSALDEPPTPAHGLSTATQPSPPPFSRSIAVPRSVLASLWCLRLR